MGSLVSQVILAGLLKTNVNQVVKGTLCKISITYGEVYGAKGIACDFDPFNGRHKHFLSSTAVSYSVRGSWSRMSTSTTVSKIPSIFPFLFPFSLPLFLLPCSPFLFPFSLFPPFFPSLFSLFPSLFSLFPYLFSFILPFFPFPFSFSLPFFPFPFPFSLFPSLFPFPFPFTFSLPFFLPLLLLLKTLPKCFEIIPRTIYTPAFFLS